MEKNSTLHPSVEEFKQFVKKHPLIMKEVKEEKKSLQEFYEEWAILGEDDTSWERYQSKQKGNEQPTTENNSKEENPINQESLAHLFSMLKRLNINDIQHHLSQFNGLVANIQGIIQQFQSNQSNTQQTSKENPLSFRKD